MNRINFLDFSLLNVITDSGNGLEPNHRKAVMTYSYFHSMERFAASKWDRVIKHTIDYHKQHVDSYNNEIAQQRGQETWYGFMSP